VRIPLVFPDKFTDPVKEKADKDDIVCQQKGRNVEKVWGEKRKSKDKREETGEERLR